MYAIYAIYDWLDDDKKHKVMTEREPDFRVSKLTSTMTLRLGSSGGLDRDVRGVGCDEDRMGRWEVKGGEALPRVLS